MSHIPIKNVFYLLDHFVTFKTHASFFYYMNNTIGHKIFLNIVRNAEHAPIYSQ